MTEAAPAGLSAVRSPTSKKPVVAPEEQATLNEEKRKMRFENEQYLREKPELTMLMRVILSEILDQTPPDPVKFVAEFCTKAGLKEQVMAATSK
eukprot:CAMPEP_0114562322 /NCGR_PEP_ID=MMETSP0114-20121206/12466_1 /TAXON_ID=31324 /ORGANISM="Goniomonas sp, Strain m" /LENGTH=93 /DNA_ID=CAMNT_0001747997 /DNA_START=22 /DNA_END=303 /DNA_ORIENTATION=-